MTAAKGSLHRPSSEGHLAQYSKQYQRKVLLYGFHLNGNTLGLCFTHRLKCSINVAQGNKTGFPLAEALPKQLIFGFEIFLLVIYSVHK